MGVDKVEGKFAAEPVDLAAHTPGVGVRFVTVQ